MRKLILLLGFIGLLSFRAFSQFTSVQDGNWNLGATWGFPGNNTAGSGFPSIGQTALVQNNVTIPASFSATITDVTVDVGVYLTIASTGTLNLNGVLEIVDDGLGGNGFLDVYGTLVANQGSSFLNDGATNTKVYGIYRHNFTTSAGNILQARWNTGSTCQVVGYTSNTTAPGFVGQSFHHFTWDCPNGSGGSSTFISLGGQLTDISGNLTVSATGGASRTLRLFDNTSGNTLSIIGDLIVNSSGRLVFSTTGNTNAVTVGGNLRIENTAAATSTVTTSGTSTTITVNGNFSMIPAAATTFNLASLSGGVGTMNILGSFSINSSSTLSANSSATASINFNGTNIQTFSNSGNASSRINYTISSSSILDLGTSAIVGTGILTNNGTLRVGSTDPNGPIQLNTVSGNIRNTVGNRVYNSGSTVTYNGASKQFIGDGHPTGAGVTTRINNSSNVAITASFVIVGSLILDNGNLEVGSNTLTLNGTFTPNSNSLVTTTNSNISVGGTGSLGTLAFSGSTIINSFVLNRTSGGSVTLGSNLGIKNFGTFTHQAGTLILNGNTLTISGDFSQAGGTIQTNSSSSIIIDGSGTLPASISLGGTNLNTLTIIRSTPTVSIAPSHIISNLNLNDGTLNNTGSITMAGGATINVIAGTMTGNAPVGTSYNVDYANTGALATGLELPTSITLLNNLSKSGGGILSLSNPITVNGIMTIGGGFNAGSNAIDLKGNLVTNVNPTFTSNTVTFSGTTALSGSATPTFGGMNITGSFSPSINYQVNGNFINNGTVSHGGSVTTTFGGTTTVSGSTTTFNNISITGTLTAPTGTMNVAGNFANSGTFNNSGGTVGFTGTTSITGTVNFGSILISGTLNSPASLNVARNFTNNGTFNRGTGTVVFNGTSTQSILGSAVTDFNNVTVTNTAGPPAVQVESDQNLRGVLTLASNSIFDADGSTNNRVFKLVSSSDSPTIDASIATLPSGAQVTGNVTVQRYMAIEGANSGRIYRYISSPVSSAPVSQIQTFIPVSGAFSGASSAAAQSMFSYNETDITGDFNTGYVNFPVAANTETFAAGVGYSIFVRGNAPPVSVAGSALYELRGPIFSGNQSLPVSFTSSGTVANDGWNLVGNPYPSTIDWDATGWTRTNVNNAIYMRDNGLATPVYASYVGGAGTNGGSRYIPIGQAFFVKSDGGTPALSVAESVKVAGTQSTFFREGALPDLLRITLRQGNVSDESVLRFTASATAGFDAQWDAYKLKNQTFNLSSLTGDGKQLAINAQPALACGASVKLDVSNASTGSYNLDFSGFDSFADASMKFALIDAYVSQTIDVKQNTSYAFQVTTDPASFGRDRFTMVVGESVPTITAQGSSRCGSGSVTLTAAGAANGNYRWYEQSSGGSAIAGATAGQFATPSLIKTKTYYVASVNSSGCEVARVPVVATVNTVDQVTITTVGQSLQSNYDAGNQWYLNGQIIPGATGKLYEPKESGVYKVEVASGICTTSAERQFAITSLSNETVMDDYISISPNPTKDIVSIQVKSPNEVGVQLISLAGSVLQESKLSGVGIKKGTLNLQEQAVGLYILLIQDGSKVYRKRIIKNQ